MITQELPQDVIVFVTMLFYCVNLFITYPLQIHPANMVIEGILFSGWPKSTKRTWLKNLYRSLMVLFTIVVSLTLRDTLDKLMSVVGSLTCAPMAFILPAVFHYELLAKTSG